MISLEPHLVELARAHLALHRPLRARTSGHSMWPFLRDGDFVTILPDRPVHLGAVVLAATPSRLVLHRVIALRKDGLLLKGDAMAHPDGVIARSEVLGVLDSHSPCRDRLIAFTSRLGGGPLSWLMTRMRVAIAART